MIFISNLDLREKHVLEESPKNLSKVINSYSFFAKHLDFMTVNMIKYRFDDSESLNTAKEEYHRVIRDYPNMPCILVAESPNGQSIMDNYSPIDHFPYSPWPKDFAKDILRYFKSKGFLENNLSENVWLYAMGYDVEKPEPMMRINWLGTKENMRHFIMDHWFKEQIEFKKMKIKEIESYMPMFFWHKGKPMTLAKAKNEISLRTDYIDSFFRPNSNNA